MGAYIFKVACTVCAFQGTAREGSSGCFYQLPSGETAPVASRPAWCASCATVVDAEVVRPLADVEREVFELESGGPALESLLRDLEGFQNKELALRRSIELDRATLDWRRLRVAPARCLRCGSHEIVYFEREPDGSYRAVRHPSCEGSLVWRVWAHASNPTTRTAYSVEGVILPEREA